MKPLFVKLISFYILAALVLSGFALFIPVKETSAQGTPQYQDASNGLPTQSLWVSKPEFFDLDDDGVEDLSILGPRKGDGDRSLHVFKWDGNSWSNHSALEGTNSIGHYSYGGLEYADFDNDGDWDVAAGSHGANDVNAYLRSIGGTWMDSSSGLQGSEDGFSIEVGDYNNDGNMDLLVGGFWGADLKPYAGNGQGQWTEQSTGLETGSASNIEGYFCDVNNDGNLDIIGNLRNGNWVYLGSGNGQWVSSSEGLPEDSWGEGPDWGDFNNDGYVDIAMTVGDRTYAFQGDGTGTWEDRSAGLPAYVYESIKMEDMNADKYDDIVGLLSDGLVEVHLATGTGGWAKADTTVMRGNAEGRRLNVGDFDHNAHRDIVAGFGTEEEYGSIRVWKESTVPTALDVVQDFPDGREYFKTGSVWFVEWLSAVPSSTGARSVKLELSTEGASGPWTLIAEDIPDSGRYQWTVPDAESSGNCYIKVTLSDDQENEVSDINDNPFGINQGASGNHDPEIEVLTPSQTREPADESYTIEWSADDEDGDEVRIDLYYDEDTNPDNGMTLIDGELDNTGSYDWDCSEVEEGEYYIYGVAQDGRGGSADDYSEGTVLVRHEPQNHNPEIEVQEPEDEGEEADQEFTIVWHAEDEDGDEVLIDLYYDEDENPGNGMTLIADDLENTGEYVWDCSDVSAGEYYIYALADDGEGGTAEDYSEGTVLVSHEEPNTPPELEILEPDGEDDEADEEFEILWTAEDEDDDTLEIDLYHDDDTDPNNGKTLIAEDLENTGSYDWDTNEMEEGDYYIYGIADDGRGGETGDYSSGVMTIKHAGQMNRAPEMVITEPDGTGDEADEEFTIRWTASDEDEDTLAISLYHDDDTDPDNGKTLIASGLENTGSYLWDVSELAEGEYHVLGVADDGNGGETSDYGQGPATIDHEDTPVNHAPEIEVSTVEKLDSETIRIWWNASDEDDDEIEVSLYYDTDRDSSDGLTLITDRLLASDNYEWDISDMDEEDYYIYALAMDEAQEETGDYSSKFSIIFPELKPDLAVVKLELPSGQIVVGETVTVKVKIENIGTLAATGDLSLYVDEGLQKKQGFTLAAGAFETLEFSWTALEGDHQFRVEASAAGDDNFANNERNEKLTVQFAGNQDPADKGEEDDFPILYVGLATLLVVAAVAGALLYKQNSGSEEADWEDEETPCPWCGKETEYYEEHEDSYCHSCEEYVSEMD